MPVAKVLPSRRWWIENTVAIPVLIATLTICLVWDRRDPFEYESTAIRPEPAHAGQDIIVRRAVVWHRQCVGEAFTEIVGPDRVINTYDRGVRYPSDLGYTVAERNITLPKQMPDGWAIYRGSIRFSHCGLTSWIHPIEVQYQERSFEVRRAP